MKLLSTHSKNKEGHATSKTLTTANHPDKKSRKDLATSNEILAKQFDKSERTLTEKQATKLVK